MSTPASLYVRPRLPDPTPEHEILSLSISLDLATGGSRRGRPIGLARLVTGDETFLPAMLRRIGSAAVPKLALMVTEEKKESTRERYRALDE